MGVIVSPPVFSSTATRTTCPVINDETVLLLVVVVFLPFLVLTFCGGDTVFLVLSLSNTAATDLR